MNDSYARQPQGIPVGGQFAAATRPEPDVTLTTRRPELDGWPESLPEPEVDFEIRDGSVITTINLNGAPAFEVWNRPDDIHLADTNVFAQPGLEDNDVCEAAENWALDKHQKIADALRAEQRAAVERSRARILGAATGMHPCATDEELAAAIENNANAVSRAGRDLELASAALAARKILAAYPDAEYAEIRVGSWDNGDFVAGATIKDADFRAIHECEEQDEEEPGAAADNEIHRLLKNLGPNAAESHWCAFVAGSYGDELYHIDLKQAAEWTPAAERP